MNYKYRIKVEEKNNGEKRYIPQVATPKLTICKRSVYPWLDWGYLFPQYVVDPISMATINREHAILAISIHNIQSVSFYTEQEANDVIEFHKEQERRIELDKVKNVYFIKK